MPKDLHLDRKPCTHSIVARSIANESLDRTPQPHKPGGKQIQRLGAFVCVCVAVSIRSVFLTLSLSAPSEDLWAMAITHLMLTTMRLDPVC